MTTFGSLFTGIGGIDLFSGRGFRSLFTNEH